MPCYTMVNIRQATVDDLPAMHMHILPGNSYIMARRDGVLIDGRPDGMSKMLYDTACARDAAAGAAPLAVGSELAVGQLVNHPAAGVQPNVGVRPLDLGADEHPMLHPRIPTVQFRRAAAGQPCKQTVVLVAERPLRDEELFLDYKLRAEGPLEEWYAPVEPPSRT